MEIFVNNESETVTTGSSLQDLLEIKEFVEQKGIAIAVNNEVVTRAEWKSTILLPSDKITVIKATQGG
jgi:sulfur carrier protein